MFDRILKEGFKFITKKEPAKTYKKLVDLIEYDQKFRNELKTALNKPDKLKKLITLSP
tara:strand:- start:758 stop:931 length:174 start_codon:yes stop_codon:yes gene_type:complete